MISRVYNVEGLGHNLFFVGQFFDSDLEVAFRKHTCYIHDLEGVDLLKESRGLNLYTLSLEDMMLSFLICLLSKASIYKSVYASKVITFLNFPIISLQERLYHYTGQTRTGSRAAQIKVLEGSLMFYLCSRKPYELLHNKKPDLSYFHVFGSLCYPTNDSKDLGKLKPKADIEIFIDYAPAKASGPGPQLMTPKTLGLGLMPNPPLLTPYVPPTKKVLDTLFQPMFYECFNPPPSVASPVPAVAAPVLVNLTGLPSSTPVDQDAPYQSTLQPPQASQSPVPSLSVVEEFHDIEVAHLNNDPFYGVLILEPSFEESSSRDVIPTNVHSVNQPPEHLTLFCYFDAFLSSVEPNNYKEALKESCWIEATQEELNEFECLEVWDPVARGYRQEESIDFKEAFAPVARLEAIYDIIFDSTDLSLCETFSEIMCSKFKMSMMGKMLFFLGLQISQSPRGILLNQSKYALEIIKKYGMETRDPVDTPMVEKSKLDADSQGKEVDPIRYRRMIGSLMYLIASRPDLDSCIALTAFADLDHASFQDTRRSTSGSTQLLGDILEQVENGVVELYFVITEYQLADILTKALGRERLEFLINKLGMRSMSSETLKSLVDEEEE
ncbi:integrase, catalytic region, zinc finger, CCHC-type containing protein [Tanacetum coccineum]